MSGHMNSAFVLQGLLGASAFIVLAVRLSGDDAGATMYAEPFPQPLKHDGDAYFRQHLWSAIHSAALGISQPSTALCDGHRHQVDEPVRFTRSTAMPAGWPVPTACRSS